MPDTDGEYDLEPLPIKNNYVVSAESKAEDEQLSKFNDSPPNLVSIRLGAWFHVKWHADTSAPIFCFIAIVILVLFGVVVSLASTISPNMPWTTDFFKILGQALLTLVGAVVGASAAAGSGTRRRGGKP